MKLIIGGAYQGKLDYALEHFGLQSDDVCTCRDDMAELDMEKRIIYGFEKWLFALETQGCDIATAVEDIMPKLADKVVIATDISAGVVPLDPQIRAWREDVGRATVRLAQQADEVIRMFVGIPTRIK